MWILKSVPCIRIILSVNSDDFTFSFPIWISFIFFSWLIASAWTSNMLFNKGGEKEHLLSVSDLRGKTFNLCTSKYRHTSFYHVSLYWASHILHFFTNWMQDPVPARRYSNMIIDLLWWYGTKPAVYPRYAYMVLAMDFFIGALYQIEHIPFCS